MHEFRRIDCDPVLTEIAEGILRDEARHLAFNHVYLEDRLAGLFASEVKEGEDYSEHLQKRLQNVLDHVYPIFETLKPDIETLGIESDKMLTELCTDAKRRLSRSIESGIKMAKKQAEGSDTEEEIEKNLAAQR